MTAKGRTNVELREQFILADGVSQAMTAFKSKSPIKDGSIPTTGPITKVCILQNYDSSVYSFVYSFLYCWLLSMFS